MRTKNRKSLWMVFLLASVASTPLAAKSKKLLNRSIYMPIEFELCEHLGEGILYENERAISRMPASRIYQFTYYAERKVLLPEQVRVRVVGSYMADEEPFRAELSVSVEGIHTAHRFRPADTQSQLLKQRRKIDKRLEKRTIRLVCKRFCKRERQAAASDTVPTSP